MKGIAILKGQTDAIYQLIEKISALLVEVIKEYDGEIDLIGNDYGFVSAWLDEDGVCVSVRSEEDGVWWDSTVVNKMDELTELCALYEVVKATIMGIESED